MATSEPGVSRRGVLQRLLLLLLGAPLVRLSETVARAERHRRHHRGPDPDEIWIGHC
jgi:hypothetical protein